MLISIENDLVVVDVGDNGSDSNRDGDGDWKCCCSCCYCCWKVSRIWWSTINQSLNLNQDERGVKIFIVFGLHLTCNQFSN